MMDVTQEFRVAAEGYREALLAAYALVRRDLAVLDVQMTAVFWPRSSKRERSRWRRATGCRSPQMWLQLAGATTI